MFRKKWTGFFIFLPFCFLFAWGTAHAEKRAALIIGNSNYNATATLKNPRNDALDMAKTLKDLGFDVICEVDADREDMDTAVQKFYRKLRHSQAGFFYYAGHGMQIDGINYLLPIDIRVSSSGDVKHRAIKMDWILSKMQDSGSVVNIVVLDACRDNPFRGFRGTGNGLAPIQCVRGSFIAYATSPGSVARDGRGRNGVYTSHLLRNINKPGLTVEEVFREVRKGVAADTNDKQIPWDSSSLMGEFYVAGASTDDKRIEVAGLPKDSTYPQPSSSSSNIVDKDGVYVAYANGVVRDTKTSLEWVVGPEKNINWYEARSWVEKLNLEGRGWRMPTMDELRSLYWIDKGENNVTALLKTTCWKFWSGETTGASDAWVVTFTDGDRFRRDRENGNRIGVFAVRSTGDVKIGRWAAWQSSRETEYIEFQKLDKNNHHTPELKAAIWECFLALVSVNNPFSNKDEELRSTAKERVKYWKKYRVVSGQLTSEKPNPVQPILDEKGGGDVCLKYDNGIVKDRQTELEWKAGPNKDTTWSEAKSWIQSLNLESSQWRMPTVDELEGLHKKGSCSLNMMRMFRTTGRWVWSDEAKGPSNANAVFLN